MIEVEYTCRQIQIPTMDRHRLVKLALDAQLMQKAYEMSRIRLEQARSISEAAGDELVSGLNIPSGAQNVNIDLNTGTVTYYEGPPTAPAKETT